VDIALEQLLLTLDATKYTGPEVWRKRIADPASAAKLAAFIRSKVSHIPYTLNLPIPEGFKGPVDQLLSRGFTGAVDNAFVTGVSFVLPSKRR